MQLGLDPMSAYSWRWTLYKATWFHRTSQASYSNCSNISVIKATGRIKGDGRTNVFYLAYDGVQELLAPLHSFMN